MKKPATMYAAATLGDLRRRLNKIRKERATLAKEVRQLKREGFCYIGK